jgi:hypothetical protein
LQFGCEANDLSTWKAMYLKKLKDRCQKRDEWVFVVKEAKVLRGPQSQEIC